jgi:hypothetical protein
MACQLVNRVDNDENDMNVPKQNFVKSHSRVRFIHNDINAGPINIMFGQWELFTNLGYRGVTDYIRVRNGTHPLNIVSFLSKRPLKMSTLQLEADMVYTVIIQGHKQVEIIAIVDDDTCSVDNSNKAKIRFIHAAVDVPTLDIWSGYQTKVFSNVKYASATPYEELSPENVLLNVTPAGSDMIILGPINLILDAGKTYTLVASGVPGAVSVLITTDSDCSLLNV